MANAAADVVSGAARIRDTAKWLTISLATLGGVLIAGTQLSNIGDLRPGTDRFTAAIAGAAVAALAAVIIMWLSILIATSHSVTVTDLTGKDGRRVPKGVNTLLTDPRFLNGRHDVSVLDEEYVNALERRDGAYKQLKQVTEHVQDTRLEQLRLQELLRNPKYKQFSWDGERLRIEGQLASLKRDLETAIAERAVRVEAVNDLNGAYTALNATVIRLLDTASYRNLAYRWRRTGAAVLALGIIAAGGIGLFVWAANPPASAQASAATPSVLTTPARATITLTAAGRAALSSSLGGGCPLSSPLAGLKLGTTDAGADVLVQQAGCTSTRFIALPEWAAVHDEP